MWDFFKRLFSRPNPQPRVLPPHEPAPVVADPAFAGAIEEGRSLIRGLMAETRLPGLEVALGFHDRLIWSEGFGFADLEASLPVTPRTQFRIASVSKVLTAAALARLWQDGRIDIDVPIAQWLPEWPWEPHRITPRMLAGHLGGVRHYVPGDFRRNIDRTVFRTAAEALQIFRDDPPVAAPGAQYFYTTFGYTLLSAAMESATGRSFFDLMEETVLRPLGLQQTAPNHPDAAIGALTKLYAPAGKNGWRPLNNTFPAYKWAGGGYVSTAHDLVRFGMAHLGHGFLGEKAKAALFSPQLTSDGTPTGVGIGWVITRDSRGRAMYFHNGSQAGARSLLSLFPEDGLVISVLSNVQNVPDDIEGIGAQLAALFSKTI